jgi:hypothetical protein
MASSDPILDRLFARYRAAVAYNRPGGSRSLASVDAVLEARVCLYEHLVASGWDAPPAVRRQLQVDQLLLEQPPSLLAG